MKPFFEFISYKIKRLMILKEMNFKFFINLPTFNKNIIFVKYRKP
ncbi:MAG: hypothetical protein BWX51_00529 [Bacteroidetes bacterium ADurb.Bin012]|jgi:hypothetical protein|nr:MAG: hypothetical protein BWX51_00529 [Bacteroidetes bacterium ADurb.Bin012]